MAELSDSVKQAIVVVITYSRSTLTVSRSCSSGGSRSALCLSSRFLALCGLDVHAARPGTFLLAAGSVALAARAGELLAMFRKRGHTPLAWPIYAGTALTVLAAAAPVFYPPATADMIVGQSWLARPRVNRRARRGDRRRDGSLQRFRQCHHQSRAIVSRNPLCRRTDGSIRPAASDHVCRLFHWRRRTTTTGPCTCCWFSSSR